jgi:hypothetical protein
MSDPDGLDLGEEVLACGSADYFVASRVALRDAPALLAAAQRQAAALRADQAAAATDSLSVRDAAARQLNTARERLGGAADRAAAAVSEYEERRVRLQAIADAFAEQRAARAEEEAVETCRRIADAYVKVLHALAAQTKGGGAGGEGVMKGMETVAGNIAVLIQEVELVRRAGAKSLFGESLAVNKRILASIENRCVDAVIKARAAFVNVMDNEFRAFGWPMKVPRVGENSEMIAAVNYYVKELHMLQGVAEASGFVLQRTRWHRSLSDSWAMAAILRAPLARFKYHFLENYRASVGGGGGGGGSGGDDDNVSTASSVVAEAVSAEAAAASDSEARARTARFDRPEWAADFALARIGEAAPFLREIILDDSCTADLKFAEGFCKVFANKIAYDSDIAIRGKQNEEGADGLISHAADIAASFDGKIRTGIVANNPIFSADDKLPSSLDILSANEDFFANWALSEQRLAQVSVLESIAALLGERGIGSGGSELDLEMECAEIVDRISQASRGCRGLDSRTRMLTFVNWTELRLLESVWNRLREVLTDCNWEPTRGNDVFLVSRSAWISHALALALESKACDRFYVALEEESGAAVSSVYDSEIERLRDLSKRAADAVSDSMCDKFMEGACDRYQNSVRFGEVVAPDAAVVLAHDLSEELCTPMGALEEALGAIGEGVANRKIAGSIWRPAAARLDAFFLEDVVLQCWTGGSRNGVSAASSSNAYMVGPSAAKMARQVAHDAGVLVGVFSSVTNVPERWLGRCADAARLMRIGAVRVLRPKAPVRQEDEEVLAAVLSGAVDKASVAEMIGIASLSSREAREILIVSGMYNLIPLE